MKRVIIIILLIYIGNTCCANDNNNYKKWNKAWRKIKLEEIKPKAKIPSGNFKDATIIKKEDVGSE